MVLRSCRRLGEQVAETAQKSYPQGLGALFILCGYLLAWLPRQSGPLGICGVKETKKGLEVGPEWTQDAPEIGCFFKMSLLEKGLGLGFDPCAVGFLPTLDLGVVFIL